MIESYFHSEEGYNPFLISQGWQVAQLNYLPTHGLDDIIDIECHSATDEVFILLEGVGVLIAANVDGDDISFEYQKMKPFVTYNIPCGVWHNIAMSSEARIIIVERDNTHLNDCEHIPLNSEQLSDVYCQIAKLVAEDV